ncbi:MAG: hypothetical protein HYX29_03610 [Solirubrobacterales bacterium]|nr:hypothetical protein [Solirubrobacterales bacterium]
MQAIEGLGTAAGQTLYYQWPSFGGGEQGFVDSADSAFGGGIARAAVSANETFYAASDPVTVNTYAVAHDPAVGTYDLATEGAGNAAANGSVNFIYGRIDNGASSTYRWMVASHTTATGACVNPLGRD